MILELVVVLVAAKLGAELSERLGVPAVLGEIAAGLLVGPSALGLVHGEGEVLHFLAELGVVLLLLQVGMEIELHELRSVGRGAVTVALIGIVAPFAGGIAVGLALGQSVTVAVFIGAALTATSVGITARVFSDLGALATPEARTVLGAAVTDDVIGLVILTVVSRLATGGSLSVGSVAVITVVAFGFLALAGVTTGALLPRLLGGAARRGRTTGAVLVVAVAVTLGVAHAASLAGLAPLVGAFVVGLAVNRWDGAPRVRREIGPISQLLVPVFFVQIGLAADLAVLADPKVLGLAGLLLVVAVGGKLVAGLGVGGRHADRLLVGLGMLPRGEVGLIFAGIGLRAGVLDQSLYGALLVVVLVTTVLTPPLLRLRLNAQRKQVVPPAPVAAAPTRVDVVDGVVTLSATPADHEAARVALDAAVATAAATPSGELLDWLSSAAGRLRWTAAATGSLLTLLRAGNARSWRLLETTGALDALLPDLSGALERRRTDATELDPLRVFTWATVSRLHELAEGTTGDDAAADLHRSLEKPDLVVLAALVRDAAGDDPAPVAAARRLVQRLDLGAAAEQEVALLVGQPALLRAQIGRLDWLEPHRVLTLAGHLQTVERARALHLLTLASEDLDVVLRSRLDRLLATVETVLARPGLVGVEARNLLERQRRAAEQLVPPAARRTAVERLEHAPADWLVVSEPAALARGASLLDPSPRRGRPRVRVHSDGPHGGVVVEVACRDERGALARVASVVAAGGFAVEEAATATWADGVALMTFTLAPSATPPEAADLEEQLALAWRGRVRPVLVPEAVVTFDQSSSPWHTICEVVAPDRLGLLAALASACTAAGTTIHAVRAVTERGVARDVFELTDGRGGKLTDTGEDALVRALTGVGRRPDGADRPRSHATRTTDTDLKHPSHSGETAGS